MKHAWIVGALSLALAGCNSSTTREPADGSDAATQTQDASAERDGATMEDASSGGDAGSQEDAHVDAAADAGSDAGTTSTDSYVYIGGWGNGDYPVKTFALDGKTGALSPVNTSSAFGVSPSFITANSDGTLLYMTNEDERAPGITVATIDAATGVPSKLDKRSDPGGGGLVHAAISPDGKTLLAADYGKGRLVAFPISGDGTLGASVSTINFGGSANTHSSGYHPSGRWAFSPNKGLDVIGQLDVNAANGQVSRRADFKTEGDGPRMVAITKDGKYAFVMFENDSSLEAYSIDNDGLLTRIDREQTLPTGFTGRNSGAHALLHPNGKVLYVSNRGANMIVAYTVESNGTLTQLSQTPSGGKTPRCFAIDAAGKWLVVGNQDENNLVTFAIASDGRLTQTGASITGVQAPTAVAIVPKR